MEDYLQRNIFELVEERMPDTTFYPRPDILERKVGIYKREADGKLWKYPIVSDDRADSVEKVSMEFLVGSGGLFGTTRDYLALLGAILQCEEKYRDGDRQCLLSPRLYRLLFEPSLTSDTVKSQAAASFADQNCWAPTPTPESVNHSVGLALTLRDSSNGRRAGSGGWYGIAHTQFWVDSSSGIAVGLSLVWPWLNAHVREQGVCNTQIIGEDPMPWNDTYKRLERALYDNLVM